MVSGKQREVHLEKAAGFVLKDFLLNVALFLFVPWKELHLVQRMEKNASMTILEIEFT